MKGNTFIGFLVLGVLLVVFPGISYAGGMMDKSSGETRSMEQGSNKTALEPGSYEYWQAVEAGTLPVFGVQPRASESTAASNVQDESEPKELIGGIEFRQIDLGP
jgi:hypothetical protein